MKNFNNNIGLFICVATLSSCVATQASNLKAALLVAPSADSARIIEAAITKLLNGNTVKIADNVFSAKNEIIIERAQLTDKLGNQLNGRITIEAADVFSLLKDDKHCYLQHNQSGKKQLLPSLECKEK